MSSIEKIIRPIVEGQIKGFLKEHPPVVKAVDWYKPRKDKTTTFVNSLSKRIVRDLTCGIVTARLAAALLEHLPEAQPESAVEFVAAAEPGPSGMVTWAGRVRPRVNRPIRKVVRKTYNFARIPETGPLTPRLQEKRINTQAIGFRFEKEGRDD